MTCALSEDLGSAPSIHSMAYALCNSSPRGDEMSFLEAPDEAYDTSTHTVKRNFFTFICAHACTRACRDVSTHVESRGKLSEVSALVPV